MLQEWSNRKSIFFYKLQEKMVPYYLDIFLILRNYKQSIIIVLVAHMQQTSYTIITDKIKGEKS